MTPKQKAEELFDKMSTNNGDEHHHCTYYVAKQCALIAVDEILISVYKINFYEYPYDYSMEDRKHLEYWQEVKQEIENL